MSSTNGVPDRGAPPPTPRWVKAFGIVALGLVLVTALLLLTGLGGSHGPGRHMPSAGPVSRTPPTALSAPQP